MEKSGVEKAMEIFISLDENTQMHMCLVVLEPERKKCEKNLLIKNSVAHICKYLQNAIFSDFKVMQPTAHVK